MTKNNRSKKEVKNFILLAVLAAAYGALNGVIGAAAQVYFETNKELAPFAFIGGFVTLLILSLMIVNRVGTFDELLD